MINYKINTNGPSSQLVIELTNDAVYIAATAVGYIEGDIKIDASGGGVTNQFKATVVGTQFFKPAFKGTGKIYLKASLGSFHIFDLKDEIVLANNSFVACACAIKFNPHRQYSLSNFLTGTPMITNLATGSGKIVMKMPGPIEELKLDNSKFVSFLNDIAAYTPSLKVTREIAAKGWLSIAHKNVYVYRGTGSVYFTPHPNKMT